MNIVTVEQALTKFFSTSLELTVDSTIFRGSLPSSKTDAIGIITASALNGNEPSQDTFTCQLLGRYTDRDTALELTQEIDLLLPVYGHSITINETVLKLTILKVGSPGCYPTSHKGRDITGLSANLKIRVR